MNKKEIVGWCGLIVGVVGAITAVTIVMKRRRDDEHTTELRSELGTYFHDEGPQVLVKSKAVKKKVIKKKVSSLAQQKQDKASALLSFMKAGKQYTQVELQEISKIPYRSVRRYIDALVKDQKISAKGYGKGRKLIVN